MRYGSVCSGIEAATVAWHTLGWEPQFFSEIEAAPRAVLSHHYPEVPLHGDFTTIQDGQYGAIDLLVGGTPCQSFSVAGLRGGLADDRGNLALQYLRLAQRLRPRWLVWENVPGVLSSWSGPQPPSDLAEGQEWEAHETSDFGCFLSGMVELGYGFAYRVLDAQYVRVDGFGRAVPQRRRRVFVVGHLGDWRRAAAVLFERASLRGDLAPSREAREDVARCLTRGSGGGQRYDWDTENFVTGCLNGISEYRGEVPTLRAKGGDAAGGSEALIAFQQGGSNVGTTGPVTNTLTKGNGNESGGVPCIAFSCKDNGRDATTDGVTPTLRAMGGALPNGGGQMAIAFQERGRDGGRTLEIGGEVAFALTAPSGGGRAQERNILHGWAVRRLTPLECERLQGFPDGYTAVPWRGGILSDGPRYKALGNSMAVNCMRWIGTRIEAVEALSAPVSLMAAE